ncbi:Glyco_18 domain containing protein [Dermatophagoides farinae]|uniref:Glyco_18 domain containing protein n=1 Tax=Dermatophagoides farinae TaxID=6954 RepID=A0A922HN12_DERFA|nr:Glyco_18 domain containing protein [Dermatophagoides farinae]
MKLKILIFSLFFFIISSSSPSLSVQQQDQFKFKRVCYLRPEANFPIDRIIEQNLCTHIIIAFVSIGEQSELSYDQNVADFIRICRQSIDSNVMNSNVKLMFSIGAGGWKMASSTDTRRKHFVNSILQFIREYQLDGVDIDWEFPAWPKKLFQYFERNDFIDLLHEIRNGFNQMEHETGKHLILSAAVAAQFVIIQHSYRAKEMAKFVDFINLMTYDYFIYKWYFPYVGHNSPLHSPLLIPFDNGPAKTFTVKWSAEYWTKIGMPKHKIMVGIPTYGKRYILFHEAANFPGAIAIKGEDDMSYSEVCAFLKRNNTIMKYDGVANVPYAYNQREWISFENTESASKKAEWICMNNFGGIMIFSLNADDYRQQCSSSSSSIQLFPIHMAIRDTVINNYGGD